jgi:hypothetical protein
MDGESEAPPSSNLDEASEQLGAKEAPEMPKPNLTSTRATAFTAYQESFGPNGATASLEEALEEWP